MKPAEHSPPPKLIDLPYGMRNGWARLRSALPPQAEETGVRILRHAYDFGFATAATLIAEAVRAGGTITDISALLQAWAHELGGPMGIYENAAESGEGEASQ